MTLLIFFSANIFLENIKNGQVFTGYKIEKLVRNKLVLHPFMGIHGQDKYPCPGIS